MVARGLSEAKPLWRPEGGREGECLPEGHGEGLQEGDGLSGGQRDGWREGGMEGGRGDSRGKRVRGGERRERDDCLPEASRRVKVAVGLQKGETNAAIRPVAYLTVRWADGNDIFFSSFYFLFAGYAKLVHW